MQQTRRNCVTTSSANHRPASKVCITARARHTVGVKNGLKLIDLRGLDYDDEAYSKILDQLTDDDYDNGQCW